MLKKPLLFALLIPTVKIKHLRHDHQALIFTFRVLGFELLSEAFDAEVSSELLLDA